LGNELNASEGSSFWLDSRAEAVLALLSTRNIETIWDIGAGGGAMVDRLGKKGIEVVSVEPLPEGAISIASVGGEVFCSSLQELELPPKSIRAIALFDVLEHLDQPEELLREIHRILEPEGVVIITVPAFQSLWSAEDIALGHFRRYTKSSLAQLIAKEGYSILTNKYIFAALVPLAFLMRTLPYRLLPKQSQLETLSRNTSRLAPSPQINALATFVLRLELRLARWLPLPFGLSVLAIGEKDTNERI
jgi:2-polyprenyl-3-methyl-5-hydroxy-6-metoxy-1,4-benzoquinol methylase